MDGENYCVVSKELLLLFRWLCKHESHALKKIINRAWARGLAYSLKEEQNMANDLETNQEVIFDFFTLLEVCITDAKKNHTEKIQALLERADERFSRVLVGSYDDETMSKTLSQAVKEVSHDPGAHVQGMFLKEFLKCWKAKNDIQH